MPRDCTFTQGIPYQAFILGTIHSNPKDKKEKKKKQDSLPSTTQLIHWIDI